jgi:hypothetical protein
MTVERAITAYIRLEKYMHFSTAPSTDPECTKNSVAFRQEFIKILESANMEKDSTMQQAAGKAQTAET